MDYSEVAIQPPQRVTGPFREVIEYLLDRPAGAHGYVLWNDTGCQSATVYRVLSRLVAGGWASQRVDDDHPGPDRQIYALTEVGRTGSTAVLARHHRRRRLPVTAAGASVPRPRTEPLSIGASGGDTPIDAPALAVS